MWVNEYLLSKNPVSTCMTSLMISIAKLSRVNSKSDREATYDHRHIPLLPLHTMPTTSSYIPIQTHYDDDHDNDDHHGDVERTVLQLEEEEEDHVDSQNVAVDSNEQSLPRLGIVKMCISSISMLGVSFIWTVELAYGTPYLKSLGLSNSSMSLVWLAGPISGLVMQPLIGAYSDKLTWKIGKRRPFILAAGVAALASLWVISYASLIAYKLVDAVQTETVAILLAVGGFYALDFSINAVQACCRALLVDIVCTEQQGTISAIAGFMNNLGNLLGYAAGWMPLTVYFPFLGKSQFRSLCSTASIIFLITIAITCIGTKERPKRQKETLTEAGPNSRGIVNKQETWYEPLVNILRAFRHSPPAIRAICHVQFCSWLGWFPFLFYATTWVAQHSATELSDKDPMDVGIRAGSFALFMSSLVSLIVLGIAPIIRQASHHVEDELNETPESGLTKASKSWSQMFTLPKIWSASQFWYAFVMGATFFANDMESAIVLVACTGLSWGVTLWAPYTLIGEFVTRQLDTAQVFETRNENIEYQHPQPINAQTSTPPQRETVNGGSPSRNSSPPSAGRRNSPHRSSIETNASNPSTGNNTVVAVDNRPLSKGGLKYNQQQSGQHGSPDTPRLSTSSSASAQPVINPAPKNEANESQMEAGLALGIHNAYITFPQFFSIFLTAILFWVLDAIALPQKYQSGDASDPNTIPPHAIPTQPQKADYDPFGWALRLSGLAAIFGGILARKLDDLLHKYNV